MKKKFLFHFVLMLFNLSVIAQNTDCNRTTWIKQDEMKIPKNVCIPKGYTISNIYEPTDLNDDNRIDFIFKWRKVDLHDGDTLFITIYFQNPDSSFSFYHTFSNLFPIFLNSYKSEYIPKNKRLREIQKKYDEEYPFIKLIFEKGLIIIKRKGDATSDLKITYKFDKELNNWVYEKCLLNNFVEKTIEPYDLSEKLGPTIDNFTYFIWE